MKTTFGQELWEEVYGKKTSPKQSTQKKISIYIPPRQFEEEKISINTIPTSTTSLDSLIIPHEEPHEEHATQEYPSNQPKPEHKLTTISDLKPLELHDIVKYSQHKGIVGEEALVVSTYLALSHNIHLGVEGYSGSGKTFLTDTIIDLIPKEEIYRAELSSKQAMFHDEERINKAKLLYFPELQKALQDKAAPAIELIKNITEGRDAKRLITSKQLGGSDELVITKDKVIIYTLAKENSFKKDIELSRRVMQLITDSTPEHIQAIHNYKAQARAQIKFTPQSEELTSHLRKHLQNLRNLSVQVIDPFAEYLQAFIPQTQKSVGYIDHYYKLVDACTRFHYQDREHFSLKGQDYLLAQVQDHHYIHSLYYNEFIKTLDSLVQKSDQEHIIKKNRTQHINWKDCFLSGKENLNANTELQAVIKNNPSLLNNWEYRQVKQGDLYTKDYKTGKFSVLKEGIELNKDD